MDIEKELRFMAEEYGLTEKQVLSWFRQAVRSMWSDSIFKRELEKEHKYEIINDNPRSMKKYPKVSRIKCVSCGEGYSPSVMDLDHIKGENSLTKYSQAEDFFKAIMFVPKKDLQWLCGDRKKTVNKKKVTAEIGCHSIKSQMEMNPLLDEYEAWATRELARIRKYEDVAVRLIELGVKDLPKTIKGREELLYELLVERARDDG